MLLVWDLSISSSTPLFSNLKIRVCFKVHFCICICWQFFSFFPCRLNSLSYPGWMSYTMRYQLFKMLCQKSSLILLWQVLVKPMGWRGAEKHCWNQKLLALSYPLAVSRMFVIYIYIYELGSNVGLCDLQMPMKLAQYWDDWKLRTTSSKTWSKLW